MDGDELDAEDAWRLARTFGLRRIVVDSFVRFRYGDGFTNSRALALQASLAVVPFLLALTGLASDLDEERPAKVVARTIQTVSPGGGASDALANAVQGPGSSERAGELALSLGLVLALLSMTTAMAQVERGANRIYGIRRDRPLVAKYGRAAVLTLVLAAPGRPRLPAPGGRWRLRRRDGDQLRLVGRHGAGLPDRALAGRHRAARPRDRGAARPRAPAAAAGRVLAGAGRRDRGAADAARHRRARRVRARQLVLRQHLRPAGRDRGAAGLVAALGDLVLLRRRGLRPAGGAARRRSRSRRTPTRGGRTAT